MTWLRGSRSRSRALATCVAAGILAAGIVPAAHAADDDVIDFTNYYAYDCALDALGLEYGAEVTVEQAASITTLQCYGGMWDSFADFTLFPNLTNLSINAYFMVGSDTAEEEEAYDRDAFAPLAALTTLTRLSLDVDSVYPIDFTPLNSLTNLESLSLDTWNQSRAEQLAPMSSLTSLRVFGGASTLEGIDEFANLESLTVDYVTPPGDENVPLTPIAGLDHLETFYAHGAIAPGDLSDLADKPNLRSVDIMSSNQLHLTGIEDADALESLTVSAIGLKNSDLALAAALPSLTTLALDKGSISTLSPLAGNTMLKSLSISSSNLSDIAVLATLTNLAYVGLGGNHISDFTPLEDLPLTNYYAQGQTYAPVTVTACEASELTTAVTRLGVERTLLPSQNVLIRDGVTAKWSVAGTYTASFADGDFADPIFDLSGDHISGSTQVTVLPAASPCAWSAGLTLATADHFVTGEPLTATLTWQSPLHPEVKVEWVDGTGKVIGTGAKYIYTIDKMGIDVRARVTALTPGFDKTPVESAPAPIARTFPATMSIVITGTPRDGETLIVEETGRPVDAMLDYQWLRDGAPIAGANVHYYQLTSADVGHAITLRGHAHDTYNRYWPIDIFSAPVTPTAKLPFTTLGTPRITGTATPYGTLTVNFGTWLPQPEGYLVQWYRNGVAVVGGTGAEYSPKKSDLGAKFTARVTPQKTGYAGTPRTTAAVTIVREFYFVNAPRVSGTPRVGSRLSAVPGDSNPSATFTYQWYRNGVAIKGATSTTYTARPGDAFAKLSVKASAKRSGYLTTVKGSAARTVAGLTYSSCTSLRRAYPGGVAKSASIHGLLSTTYVSAALYSLNSARDIDKDGWACEP